MSECLMAQRGGKYTRGRTITDENLTANKIGGDLIWGPTSFYSNGYYSDVTTDGNRFYITRLGSLEVGSYHLMCIDPEENGIPAWGLQGAPLGTIAFKHTLVGDRILVGLFGNGITGTPSLESYDINGNLKWSYKETQSDSTISVTACCWDDAGNAYAFLNNGYIVKLNSDGVLQWRVHANTTAISNYAICVGGTKLYVVYTIGIEIYDTTSGTVINTNYLSMNLESAPTSVVISDDKSHIYFPMGQTKLVSVDVSGSTSGVIDYTVIFMHNTYGVDYHNGFLYVGGDLEKYRASTGTLIWHRSYSDIPNNNGIIGRVSVNDNAQILGISNYTGSDAKILLAEANDVYTITN